MPDNSHVLSLDSVVLDPNLSFEEKSITIFDRQVRKLRKKEIALVKLQWKHHSIGEATWEKIPTFMANILIFFRL